MLSPIRLAYKLYNCVVLFCFLLSDLHTNYTVPWILHAPSCQTCIQIIQFCGPYMLPPIRLAYQMYNSVVLMCSLPSHRMWDSLGKNCAHCSCGCQNCSYVCRSVVSLQVLNWWFEMAVNVTTYCRPRVVVCLLENATYILLHLMILRCIQYCHFFLGISLCIWVPEVDEMFLP
jgi:hypothetical protein